MRALAYALLCMLASAAAATSMAQQAPALMPATPDARSAAPRPQPAPPAAQPPSAPAASAAPAQSPAQRPAAAPRPAAPRDPASQPQRAGEGQVALSALITDDGQRIEQGMLWHIYRDTPGGDPRQAKLVTSLRGGSQNVKLPAGDYIITGTFGRAYAARRVKVNGDAQTTETFVLNAGGLRPQAFLPGGEVLPAQAVSIDIYSDERDQAGNRTLVVGAVRPGIVLRLNSGIYHLVSTYGDANAQVRSDVTVEAGKLTEAAITHHAARVTFKLVNRAGGDALADTQWSISSAQGIVVKESVGALPTHLLAPGTYRAIARSGGRVFQRDFSVKLGDNVQVEVIAQ